MWLKTDDGVEECKLTKIVTSFGLFNNLYNQCSDLFLKSPAHGLNESLHLVKSF